jgi:hypothetical protein
VDSEPWQDNNTSGIAIKPRLATMEIWPLVPELPTMVLELLLISTLLRLGFTLGWPPMPELMVLLELSHLRTGIGSTDHKLFLV